MQSTRRLNPETVVVACKGYCGEDFQITLTEDQEDQWRGGGLIQNVAPNLDADDRELLISGTCQVCWDKLFPPEEEEMRAQDDYYEPPY